MLERFRIRQSVRELSDDELRVAHAAIVELLARFDMQRVQNAQEARTHARVDATVGAGGFAVIAAGLIGLSFLTFGLTGLAGAGALAARAAHAAGGKEAMAACARTVDDASKPTKDRDYLAQYEELCHRKSCLEEEMSERTTARAKQLKAEQTAQTRRQEWGKLVDAARRPH